MECAKGDKARAMQTLEQQQSMLERMRMVMEKNRKEAQDVINKTHAQGEEMRRRAGACERALADCIAQKERLTDRIADLDMRLEYACM